MFSKSIFFCFGGVYNSLVDYGGNFLSENGGLYWCYYCVLVINSKYILLWTGGFLLVIVVSDQCDCFVLVISWNSKGYWLVVQL